MAGIAWTVVTLWLVGTPVGIVVTVCTFIVLFPCRALIVGRISSKERGWMEVSFDCLGFSALPVAVKPSAMGLENVASTGSSDVDVPA